MCQVTFCPIAGCFGTVWPTLGIAGVLGPRKSHCSPAGPRVCFPSCLPRSRGPSLHRWPASVGSGGILLAVVAGVSFGPFCPQVARKLVILEGELERAEERAEVSEL